MNKPDWRNMVLEEGILREPILDASRIVLWVPGERDAEYRHWERIGNVPGADIYRDRGLCATQATSIRAREQLLGLVGKLLQRFRKPPEGQTWVLPTGQSTYQVGEREQDLVLVWNEDEAFQLDEERIKRFWPDCRSLRRLGNNLFLGAGLELIGSVGFNPARDHCRDRVQQHLDAAREANDPLWLAAALTDMAVVFLRSGEAPRGLVTVEQALGIARDQNNRAFEADALGTLALVVLVMNQVSRGIDLLDQQRAIASETGDQFVEKGALDKLGTASAELGQFDRCFEYYQQALDLARQLGDRRHEAEILWFTAIQKAELGQRDEVFAAAEHSLAIFEELGHPRLQAMQANLQKYAEMTDASAAESATQPTAAQSGGKEPAKNPPRLLREALFLAKSAANFFEDGLRRVSLKLCEARLEQCGTCGYFTGTRCRATNALPPIVAWLPHETCPLGKWPT